MRNVLKSETSVPREWRKCFEELLNEENEREMKCGGGGTCIKGCYKD